MNKYFFVSCLGVFLFAATSVWGQTPIEEFLKKYPSQEGVTTVSISPQMLQSIFAQGSKSEELVRSVPEAYSSVIVKSQTAFDDFKKLSSFASFEEWLSVNRENNNVLGYYFKKSGKNNEILVLRQQKDQFSAIFIKGDIDINNVDKYLWQIRGYLARLGVSGQNEMFSFGFPEYSFAMVQPFVEDLQLKLDELQFDFPVEIDVQKAVQAVEKQVKDSIEKTWPNDIH